ncbi:MAG TPA: choice-of-anchor Q domain-containing protein, partial [Humisphaera sp.]|nr:choice-of-anchor Q domain-containing protein [Humisphaera sp.]
GLMNYGTAGVTDCSFYNNAAYAHDADFLDGGGGIYNAGTLKVTRSVFHDNIADESPSAPQNGPNTEPLPWGAAIYDNGKLTLTDSTLYGNYSNAGGALTVGPYASATVINDTIAANSSDYTGGIKLQDVYGGSSILHEGKLTIGNTIVAGNSVLIDPTLDDIGSLLGGSITSLGNNLIGVTTASVWKLTDLTGTVASPLAAKLGPLANNGGPTKTAALLSGSPALNAGSNAIAANYGLTTDQRGVGRVRFGTVDIGAYES